MMGDKGAGSETLQRLESALERIVAGTAERVCGRKLSVSAVEREAGMGNGSASYYPQFVARVKNVKAQLRQEHLRQSQQEQASSTSISCTTTMGKGTAERYRKENAELRERMSQMASDSHRLADALARALTQHAIDKEVIAKYRREEVVLIKSGPAEEKAVEVVIAPPGDATGGKTAAADDGLSDEGYPRVS